MAKFDKLMQSFSQVWAIFVKMCPKMAMLCKVTASSAKLCPKNANICSLKLYNFMRRYGKSGQAM